MATFATLEELALTFPDATVEPHFEKISFRVKKKIFATYAEENNRLTVKLTETDQDNFSSLSSSIYPVDNKWGKQGWTFVELSEVTQDLLTKVLMSAYCTVAPKKLSELIRKEKK